jgi:hypothetical protein
VKVHPGALKHGVSAEDAIQAASGRCGSSHLGGDGPPERELGLASDTRALLLETVVLILEGGDEVIIHAMPARKKYLDLLP